MAKHIETKGQLAPELFEAWRSVDEKQGPRLVDEAGRAWDKLRGIGPYWR